MAGKGESREEVTRRMTDGCNKEGCQIVKSYGIYFKETDCGGSEESKGESYSGRRTVSKGYTLLLTRSGVMGCRRKKRHCVRAAGETVSFIKARYF